VPQQTWNEEINIIFGLMASISIKITYFLFYRKIMLSCVIYIRSSDKMNKLVISRRQKHQYILLLLFLTATRVGPSDHHLAIWQNLNSQAYA